MPVAGALTSGLNAGTSFGGLQQQRRRDAFDQQQQQVENYASIVGELGTTLASAKEQFEAKLATTSDLPGKQKILGEWKQFYEGTVSNASRAGQTAASRGIPVDPVAQVARLTQFENLRDLAAEQALAGTQTATAAGQKATAQVPAAVSQARQKGAIEQQQVQTSDITGYLNTKTNDVVRGYVRNGKAFNAVTNEELSADYIPTKSLSGVEGGAGVGNSTKDKTLAAAAELRAVQENTDASIGELQNFVRSEDYVEGFTEDAIQLLNSGFQQIFQLSGNENIVEESILNNSVIDLDNLSDANIGFLRRAAIGGDVRDSAKARLAYILAKQLDPNGRISNADVENAERILSGSADRAGTLLTLGQLRSRSARETNVKLGTMEQLLKSPETLFEKVDVTTGLKTNQSLDDMSDAEYIQLLNQGGQ